MQISIASLDNWKKDKTSRIVIEVQINNLYQSVRSGAFFFIM
ncbi:hypothetical protein P4J24_16890 [Bacillus anthracis]|nr:hypothetical protein [Bacillus anthracis]MEB9683563.1 hypothetical protein [Bacillus anthracis]